MFKYIKNIIHQEFVYSLKKQEIENLYAIYLRKTGTKIEDYELCGFIQLAKGTKTSINSRNISFNALVKNYHECNADAVVLLHNHPKIFLGGKLSPSEEDIEATYGIAQICYSHHMKLIDHIIINDKNYYSFVENNLIDIEED